MNRALILSPGGIAKVVARRPDSTIWVYVLMENRHGLVVDGDLTEASGTAERDTAVDMLAERPGTQRITVGGDKALRHQRLCCGTSPTQGDPACGTE